MIYSLSAITIEIAIEKKDIIGPKLKLSLDPLKTELIEKNEKHDNQLKSFTLLNRKRPKYSTEALATLIVSKDS